MATMSQVARAACFGRLATALRAGIDMRRAWKSEIDRVPARYRAAMQLGTVALDEGQSLADAMTLAGTTFMPIERALVEVGCRTGHEAEILKELSAVTQRAARASSEMRSGMVFPIFQLTIALGVIGLLILLAGVLKGTDGRGVDVLGIGLAGVEGLIAYVLILIIFAGAGVWAFSSAMANWNSGTGVVRRILEMIPVLGTAIHSSDASRWCRAASLASGAGLDAGRLVELASAAAPRFARGNDILSVEQRIRAGATLAEALSQGGRFPDRILDTISVGEEAGSTAEVLSRLASDFDDEAASGFKSAAHGAGFGVWALVAGLIILVIFRIFSTYVEAIQNAASGI